MATREERQNEIIAKWKEKGVLKRDADIFLNEIEQKITSNQEIDMVDLKARGDQLAERMKQLQMSDADEYKKKFNDLNARAEVLAKKTIIEPEKKENVSKKRERKPVQKDDIDLLREMAKDVVYPAEPNKSKPKSRKRIAPKDDLASLRDMAQGVVYPAPEASKSTAAPKKEFTEKMPHIMNEIYSTEKTYRDNMQALSDMITDHFKRTLVKNGEGYTINQEGLGTNFFVELAHYMQPYNDITQLEKMHYMDAGNLNTGIDQATKLFNSEKWWKNIELASVQLENFNKFLMANDSHKLFFSNALSEYQKTHPTFTLNVPSLLIQPIQRAPRAVLLNKDLLANVVAEHPKFQALVNTQQVIEAKVTNINLLGRLPEVEAFNSLRKMIAMELNALKKGATEAVQALINATIGNADLSKRNGGMEKGTGILGIDFTKESAGAEGVKRAYKELECALNVLRAHQSVHGGGSLFQSTSPIEHGLEKIEKGIEKSEFYGLIIVTERARLKSEIKEDLGKQKEEVKLKKKQDKQGDSEHVTRTL